MDADVPKLPEKPAIVVRSNKSIGDMFDRMYDLGKKQKASGGIVACGGAIAGMALGTGWKEEGETTVGNRPIRRWYQKKELNSSLVLNLEAISLSPQSSSKLQKITSILGPVPKSEWKNIALFGGNSSYFTVESVEVSEIVGKRVVVMVGQALDGNRSREKSVYVSLSGDWKESFEFGIGTPPDDKTWQAVVREFDEALKTIIWMVVPSP